MQRFDVVKETEFITTKPLGVLDQPNFINGSMLIKVDISKEQLYQQLKEIEQQMGRKKTKNKYGPRVIDLDIVIFGKQIIDADFYRVDFLKNLVLSLIPNAIKLRKILLTINGKKI